MVKRKMKNRVKYFLWVSLSIVGVLLAAFYLSAEKKSVVNRPSVEAIGLRGRSKVSKPLSKTQIERLQAHFLDIPAPARTGGAHGSASAFETINQVEAINRLNERQAQ